MIFKPMKPEAVRKALEGHKDILKPAMEEIDRYFKNVKCPSCKGECMKIVDARTPFREGAMLPNFLGKCKSCGVEFEPYTGIQITMPKP